MNASAEAPSQDEHDQRGWRRAAKRALGAAKRALVSLPAWARIAAGGYVVLAGFGVAYVVVWSLAGGSLSAGARAAVAGLIAAPLALGLLWPRLTGFKAFGIELSLAQVIVQPDTKLANTITWEDFGPEAADNLA